MYIKVLTFADGHVLFVAWQLAQRRHDGLANLHPAALIHLLQGLRILLLLQPPFQANHDTEGIVHPGVCVDGGWCVGLWAWGELCEISG